MNERMLERIRQGMIGFREIKQRGRLGFEHVGVNLIALIGWINNVKKNGALNSQDIQNELQSYLIELSEADDSLRNYIG
ncbi:MAG: hypothetical protein ACE5PV_25375 [Candidatus Poribacteria bacterium]